MQHCISLALGVSLFIIIFNGNVTIVMLSARLPQPKPFFPTAKVKNIRSYLDLAFETLICKIFQRGGGTQNFILPMELIFLNFRELLK